MTSNAATGAVRSAATGPPPPHTHTPPPPPSPTLPRLSPPPYPPTRAAAFWGGTGATRSEASRGGTRTRNPPLRRMPRSLRLASACGFISEPTPPLPFRRCAAEEGRAGSLSGHGLPPAGARPLAWGRGIASAAGPGAAEPQTDAARRCRAAAAQSRQRVPHPGVRRRGDNGPVPVVSQGAPGWLGFPLLLAL